ncbi:unnamed protein product [Didymodactylos carnosus]|uniref:Uncharacterized protein n=1 Tax=Didymodactylos carnosus TaxID=1234261 RepID=A0A814NER9_9BILA|nr:unnamed protein product [Didymodactylos carnosus]CAF3855972.1 unnamed protein product [Didymodactylos carnosus]
MIRYKRKQFETFLFNRTDSGCREVKDILKDLCLFNPSSALSSDRLPHDCYMILVGRVRSHEHLKILGNLVATRKKIPLAGAEEYQREFAVMNSERMESILEYIILEADTERFTNQRKSHFVYEDNFNPALFHMVRASSSYEKLRAVCRQYETQEGVDVSKVMAEHDHRVALTHTHFLKKGLSKDDASASAFALSFYTGTKSETLSRGASLIARKTNGQALEAKI